MAVPTEFRLWPPSAETRAVVAEKMVHHLTTCSRPLEKSEATEHSKRIEEEAYMAAEKMEPPQDSDSPGGDDLMVKIRVYARQASELLLDTLKTHRKSQSAVKDTVLDISGQKRDFLTAEVARKLFKPLSEPGNEIRSICLSNWSFGKEAAVVAGESLASAIKNLQDVNLADIVAGRPEAEALEVMSILSVALADSQLDSLNLSDNALGEKGVRAFSALLKSQKSLQKLYFMNNGISVEAARAICQLVSFPQDLRTLHFHNNMSGDGGAQALSALISKAPLLVDFQFSSTRVQPKGGLALVQALRSGKTLKRIDVRDNMFGPKVGVALADTLKLHPDLSELYLSDTGLEETGVMAIAKALEETAPYLKVLELGGNDITARAAPAIAKCVRAKHLLSRLNLAENDLKDKGFVIVCKALEGHPGMEFIDFSSNEIRDAGAAEGMSVLLRGGSRSAHVEVHLERNFMSEDGVSAVDKLNLGDDLLYLSDQEEDLDDEDEDEEDEDENEDLEDDADEEKDEEQEKEDDENDEADDDEKESNGDEDGKENANAVEALRTLKV